MLENEDFEQLHGEAEESMAVEPPKEIPVGSTETESSEDIGIGIFALFDAILGVSTDE